MKDELCGRILKYFIALRPKMFSYMTDDSCAEKKGKGGKNCVIKREVKFEDYEKVFGEMWINTGISAKF